MKRMHALCVALLALAACSRQDAGPLCDAATTSIAAVQGAGETSPLEGQSVVVEGVVTATLLAPGQWDGFFLQATPPDGDLTTSDGLFIHAPGGAVTVGRTMRIAGTVTERNGMTAIDAVTAVGACGWGEPAAVRLRLDGATDLEAYEGMLVEVGGPLAVADTWELGEKGRWRAVPGGRLMAPTNGTEPSSEHRRMFVVDDRSLAEPAPSVLLSSLGRPPRVGDQLGSLMGILTENEDGFALQPVGHPAFLAPQERPESPPSVGGDLRVAAMNVLNFFTTLGRRGADTAEELFRQEAKIIAALEALDADIIALVEVENGGPALDRLTKALSEANGSAYRPAGQPDVRVGGDDIRVALIYRPDRVVAVGSQQVLADPVFRNRPPIAQTFRFGTETFSVMVAHLKSKGGCGNATGPDRDQGDGQGCWNDLRVREARRLLDLASEVQRSSGDADVLVTGDLNAYGAEDPIVALRGGGLVDLTERFTPPAERYSFVYLGRSGTLDYALATPALAERATGAAYWHINADEPRVLDYDADNPAGLYRPDPFRSSDHDPVLVGLEW